MMDITLLCIAATVYDGEDEPLTASLTMARSASVSFSVENAHIIASAIAGSMCVSMSEVVRVCGALKMPKGVTRRGTRGGSRLDSCLKIKDSALEVIFQTLHWAVVQSTIGSSLVVFGLQTLVPTTERPTSFTYLPICGIAARLSQPKGLHS
jgi:hypothetical protein